MGGALGGEQGGGGADGESWELRVTKVGEAGYIPGHGGIGGGRLLLRTLDGPKVTKGS